MAESLFTTFRVSGEGLAVQRKRLSAVAKNIANANTTKTEDGGPYRREVVVVRAEKATPFQRQLDAQIGLTGSHDRHADSFRDGRIDEDGPALRSRTATDNAPPRLVYDPGHPDANEKGYVELPNVNVVTEMVEMISAQRAFEANTAVISAGKNIARDSLDI